MNISLFKNFTKGIGSRTLLQIVEEIRGNRHKDAISKIRKLVEKGDTEKVSRLKKGLEAFTVSGLFEGGRKMSFLKKYNSFVILDIDKLDPEDLPDLILKAREIPFTKVAFISPSGRGLKIIVEVDSEMKGHNAAYFQVMNFYKDNLMVEIDKSGKDITRLCFMSYDPEIYFNPESDVYNVLEMEDKVDQPSKLNINFNPATVTDLPDGSMDLNVDYSQAFSVCVTKTNAKLEFKKGNRNNYIYQLGVICSHAGLPLEIAIRESARMFDFNNNEMERTIRSAYSWQPYVPADTSSKKNRKLPSEAPPVLPEKVFGQLPVILKKGCDILENERERDVFLTGSLGILSGLLPNVTGVYDGSVCAPNLFLFVIAPAASGKGSLKLAKQLGLAYHKELLERSKRERVDFKKAASEYRRKSARYDSGNSDELPEEPEKKEIKGLFIPANASSAMLIKHLDNNDSSGILFESEADSLAKVLKQDWGGYSDLLRLAFHHETISYTRKTNDEYIEMDMPKVSVVLSGTPGQIRRLISSAEDGLFSRFMFYAFQMVPIFRDVSEEGRAKDFHLFYEDLSKEVLEMFNFLKAHPTKFTLQKKQWKTLVSTFQGMVEETNQDFGLEAVSIVMRMGLICFRMAMILSALRKFEKRSKAVRLICRDDDFESAILLAKTYWVHAVFVYERLPTSGKSKFKFLDKKKQLFYDSLPDKFQRKEAIRISKDFKISDRTADRYLRYLLKEKFLGQSLKGGFGNYFKI